MSEGIESFRVMIRNAMTEEVREYQLPVDGPAMIADLIAWIPEMNASRVIQSVPGRFGGYAGEFLEIRRLDDDEKHPASVTLVGELVDPDKLKVVSVRQMNGGHVVKETRFDDPTDPAGHEPDCTCLFCIPGA
jgi:hypothetical protein